MHHPRDPFSRSSFPVIDINQPYAMAAYQQVLLDDAFTTYRKLLGDATLRPAMGRWLDMVNNDKANPSKGTSPNENYGREVLQLFSIGLAQLNADGTPKLDVNNQPIATYDQDTVEGFAYVFTGWTFPPLAGATAKWADPKNYAGQMVAIAAHQDTSGTFGGSYAASVASAYQSLLGADRQNQLVIAAKDVSSSGIAASQALNPILTGSSSTVDAAFKGQTTGIAA